MTEFPYYWTDAWGKIGKKRNALEAFEEWVVVVTLPGEVPGIG